MEPKWKWRHASRKKNASPIAVSSNALLCFQKSWFKCLNETEFRQFCAAPYHLVLICIPHFVQHISSSSSWFCCWLCQFDGYILIVNKIHVKLWYLKTQRKCIFDWKSMCVVLQSLKLFAEKQICSESGKLSERMIGFNAS